MKSVVLGRRAGFGLAFGLLAAPFAALAQRKAPYRLGFLIQSSPTGSPGTVRRALEDLGYVDGQNIIVERRFAEGHPERFPRLAAELVALNPDLILADTTPGALAAKGATTTIPIVMINVTDPVGTGLVASLTRPGGNVTGVADMGVEISLKGLDLLHATVPKATRMAVLLSGNNRTDDLQFNALEAAAQTSGITLLPIVVKSTDDLESAFSSITSRRAGAVIALGSVQLSTASAHRKLAELAIQAKLPMLSQDQRVARVGALMGYGPPPAGRYAAHYIDKILKGAKPSELPIQQPTEFDFVINLKTARMLGLRIPQSVLLRATEIIE